MKNKSNCTRSYLPNTFWFDVLIYLCTINKIKVATLPMTINLLYSKNNLAFSSTFFLLIMTLKNVYWLTYWLLYDNYLHMIDSCDFQNQPFFFSITYVLVFFEAIAPYTPLKFGSSVMDCCGEASNSYLIPLFFLVLI